jgi:two-component system, cell cycle sensor histidine kinase and response regulator CckA
MDKQSLIKKKSPTSVKKITLLEKKLAALTQKNKILNTAHKKIQKSLQENKLKYRSLFESASDAIVLMDKETVVEQNHGPLEMFRTLFELSDDAMVLMDKETVVECNQRTLEMWRCTKEEFKNGTMSRFWPKLQPDGKKSKEKVLEILKVVKQGVTGPFYWKYLRKDGTAFDADVYMRYITFGGRGYTQSIVRDITEHRIAEDFYQIIANTSRSGVYIIQKGKLVFVNPNTADYCGCSEDELIGTDYWSLLHPEDRENAVKDAEDMLTGRRTVPFEFRIISLDGRIKHILATQTYINYKGSRAVLGNSLDITELKEMRSKYDELQVLETSILNTITHAVFGLQNSKIIFANPAAEKIFGWKTEEIVGKDALILYRSEEDYREAGKLVDAQLKQQGSCSLEIPCRDKNGREFYCILNASTIDHDSLNGRVVAVYEDITERKIAEVEKKKLADQLIQSQKMEAVGTLAGGIAHDFNNLMMGIQGYTSLMLMDIDSHNSNYRKLKNIEDMVVSGAGLTKQLLGYARGGRYEVKLTNINDLVEKTITMFGRTKKEISINQMYQKNIWTVKVDQGQIEQVLLNLFVNALQAMPGGGNLDLETKNVILSENDAKLFLLPEGRYIVICIKDTGVGMDKATRARIFEPFFTTKEMGRGRGAGLGLASAYGIIKGHNGIIDVISEKGHGSTFFIYLPATEEELIAENKSPGTIEKGNETLLLVDDEDKIIDVTSEILKTLGYNVLVAKSGSVAIDIYKEKQKEIDLVILDMIMPVMSGDETFDALKAINPQVKVILSSGYSIDGQATKIMDKGCRCFIQKPYKIVDISNKIREALAIND